jgi:dethiobiotin synthetase
MRPQEVAPLSYGPAVSPHLAAELEHERIVPADLIARARAAGEQDTLIVEGVGGLLVPLADDFSVRDLARLLALPVLIAARPGLGTINHTLLTLESARAAGLDVRAVVLTPWPAEPTPIERSNRATIAAAGAIDVEILRRARSHEPSDLARIGESLPWRRWLAPLAIANREPGPPAPTSGCRRDR